MATEQTTVKRQHTRRHAPLDFYEDAKPLLRHIRVMGKFYDVLDANPVTRELLAELHCAYMDILQKELARHALTFAIALTELEDAYPEIRRKRK